MQLWWLYLNRVLYKGFDKNDTSYMKLKNEQNTTIFYFCLTRKHEDGFFSVLFPCFTLNIAEKHFLFHQTLYSPSYEKNGHRISQDVKKNVNLPLVADVCTQCSFVYINIQAYSLYHCSVSTTRQDTNKDN